MDGGCYNLQGARMAYEDCAEGGLSAQQSMRHWQGVQEPHPKRGGYLETKFQHQTWLKAAMTCHAVLCPAVLLAAPRAA